LRKAVEVERAVARRRRVVASRFEAMTRSHAPVFVGSAFVAQYPTGGGNFWFDHGGI
jgi:hypothetical protein